MSYFRRLGAALLGRNPAPMPAPRPIGHKASATGPIVSAHVVGRPVWPERDYERFAKEGYQQNPVVSRCVELIASGVAGIRFDLQQGKGKRAKVLDEHPLLRLLENPNPEQDGNALLQAFVSHFVISGNGYLERTSEKNLDRMELYALRPDRMRVIPDTDGWPGGYEYTAGGGRKTWAIDPYKGMRPILHMRRFHPLSDWYGMSPLDPAAWSIDTHSAASKHNQSLLDNGATPTGAFVYSGGADGVGLLSPDARDALREELSGQHQGPGNAGRPLLLEGGLDWKQFGLNLEQLQFVNAKNLAAREIAFAMGVPPLLLGIPGDNTYSNYAEANRAFFRSTVIPLAERIARMITHWFRPLLGDGLALVVDLDTIDALASERAELWTKVNQSQILSVNEKREALGYTPVQPAKTTGDEIYTSAGLLPINAVDDGTISGGIDPRDGTLDPMDGGDPQRGRLN